MNYIHVLLLFKILEHFGLNFTSTREIDIAMFILSTTLHIKALIINSNSA